jgi:hypothetical protein
MGAQRDERMRAFRLVGCSLIVNHSLAGDPLISESREMAQAEKKGEVEVVPCKTYGSESSGAMLVAKQVVPPAGGAELSRAN